MGVDLHWEYYPKECDNPKILPFLNYDWGARWVNGKSMSTGFYDACRELGEWDEENHCWIFRDIINLFKFASRAEVPETISDYIAYCDYLIDWKTKHKEDDIFVIWKR